MLIERSRSILALSHPAPGARKSSIQMRTHPKTVRPLGRSIGSPLRLSSLVVSSAFSAFVRRASLSLLPGVTSVPSLRPYIGRLAISTLTGITDAGHAVDTSVD